MGIIINHHKESYYPTSIMESRSGFFFVAHLSNIMANLPGLKIRARRPREIDTSKQAILVWIKLDANARSTNDIVTQCNAMSIMQLNFKLSGITCLVGKLSRLNFYLRVHWLSEIHTFHCNTSTPLRSTRQYFTDDECESGEMASQPISP